MIETKSLSRLASLGVIFLQLQEQIFIFIVYVLILKLQSQKTFMFSLFSHFPWSRDTSLQFQPCLKSSCHLLSSSFCPIASMSLLLYQRFYTEPFPGKLFLVIKTLNPFHFREGERQNHQGFILKITPPGSNSQTKLRFLLLFSLIAYLLHRMIKMHHYIFIQSFVYYLSLPT